MNIEIRPLILALTVLLSACGGKQSKDSGASQADTETNAAAESDRQAAVDAAEKRIRSWLNTALGNKIKVAGKDIGNGIAVTLGKDQRVHKAAEDLSKAVLENPEVKARLKEIEERATHGFTKKLTLGWKALKAGGLDEFRKKVNEDTKRVAVKTLASHVKEQVLKDPRAASLFKDFAPVLKLQGQIAALSLQENLSPRVTKQVLGIALWLVSAGESSGASSRIDNWTARCEAELDPQIASLVEEIVALDAIKDAAAGLAAEVMEHSRTKKELALLAMRLTENKDVSDALVTVYEAAAFEKGDSAIQEALEKVLAMPSVNDALFATLETLASADGAGAIIGKHLSGATHNPRLAALIENFVSSILESCGDPTQS